MTTQQGSLDLLKEPVAQALLQSKTPARFAYQWSDGTPRVVPIGFHWNGEEIVLGTPIDAPKLKALRDGQSVALCIDTDSMPYKVLQIRGRVRVDEVEGIAPEYELMTLRTMGDEAGKAWLTTLAPMCLRMARVYITPTWVGLLDFETRFPSALERAMEAASAAPPATTHSEPQARQRLLGFPARVRMTQTLALCTTKCLRLFERTRRGRKKQEAVLADRLVLRPY